MRRPVSGGREQTASRDESEHVVDYLNSFDDLWEVLVPRERWELVHALVSRVAYDRKARKLHIDIIDPNEGAPAAVVANSLEVSND